MSKALKIVVTTDFSDASLAAVDWTKKFGDGSQTEVHCVNAVEQPMVYMPVMAGTAVATMPTIAELEQISQDSLNSFIKKHMSDFDGQLVTKVLVGRPAEQITDYAKEIGADMIVIATRGHSKLAHALLGSTAEGVVRQAECPVVTVRG